MILPYPTDIKNYKQFPLTLTLVFLNTFIFILIFSGASSSSLSSAALLESEGLTLTGRLYYQYLRGLSSQEAARKPAWIRELKPVSEDQMAVLGSYALRDGRFLARAEKSVYLGDEVQISQWRNDLAKFRNNYQEQHLFHFGLSAAKSSPLAWITYQFSHSNWVHLLSNLMFLLLIGSAVEGLVGSGSLLFVYVLGGFAGGLGFLLWDLNSAVPMVGASASISALLLFYCIAEPRMRVRFLYIISPLPGQYGPIYLPTLLIIPLFIAVDLSNLWSTPEGLGSGVAYAAHLGGAAIGALVGFFYRGKKLPVLT